MSSAWIREKDMHTPKLRGVGSAHIGTLLQLFLSHLLVCIFVFAGARFGPIMLLVGGLAGVVLTLNISSNLYILEFVLDRLARALPVETPSLRWRWPLTPLFTALSVLGSSRGCSLQVELQTAEYRDQLSLQVSKTAAQEERNRLARDLHDSIKQQIFGVAVSAATARARWESDPDGALRAIDDIESTALEAQVEMQALLQELRPVALENVGLIEALRLQCQALGYRTGAEVLIELVDLPSEDQLPPGSQELLFRIVQEGFGNIARHARASKVWLSLRRQQDVFLVEIGDDGQGFTLEERPQTAGGMGLKNIRERAQTLGGSLSIWSRPGAGTTLHFSIPLFQESRLAQTRADDVQLVAAARKTRSLLKFGTRVVEVALALVLLYTPAQLAFFLVGGILVIAIGLWTWAQRSLTQVALGSGSRSPEYNFLQAESSGLLAGIFLLLPVEPGYLTMVFWGGTASFWFVVGICLCSGVFLLAVIRYIVALERAYRRLSIGDLRAFLKQKLRTLAIDMLAWALLAGLMLLSGHIVGYSKLVPLDSQRWVDCMGLLFLALWLSSNLLRGLQTLIWYRSVTREMT